MRMIFVNMVFVAMVVCGAVVMIVSNRAGSSIIELAELIRFGEKGGRND